VVNGSVKNSVLFTGVIVEEGAQVIDSVLMPYTVVKSGAVVQRVLTDDHITIGAHQKVGKADGDILLVAKNVKGD
jgi:glucose-1-phosphate adenylyltransferase